MEKDLSVRMRKAVKENNLFLVRRLIQRTDMRNPDPGPQRYTSLAWAAVLGHEETFEYLLSSGHDDEELSKDTENNTILILLAGLPAGAATPYRSSGTSSESELQSAALRMARLYYERFPFVLDWSNVQGKTSLHVAALKGNEEFVRMICDFRADYDLTDLQGNTPLHYASAWGHIPVVQLLIERGCQFTAKNNEGFTASDYAYSFNTMNVLQETARSQFETNKKARRGINASAPRPGGGDWSRVNMDELERMPMNRMRSGSGGSRTTATSDGAELEPHQHSSPHSTASSNQRLPATNGQIPPPRTAASLPLRSPSGNQPLPPPPRSTQPQTTSSPSGLLFQLKGAPVKAPTVDVAVPPEIAASRTPRPQGQLSAANTTLNTTVSSATSSRISPIATRMRERDEAVMAQYLRRQRSGSNSSSADGSLTKSSTSASSAPVPPPATSSSTSNTSPQMNGNGNTTDLIAGDARLRALPRLRPSTSATSLRPGIPPTATTEEQRRPEESRNTIRARTNAPPSPVPAPNMPLPSLPPDPASSRRLAKIGESTMANGHARRPSGASYREISGA